MNELEFPKKLLEVGDKEGSVKEIIRLLQNDPHNLNAWLLLAQVIDDRNKKIDCYRQILKLDLNNSLAQSELKRLLTKPTEIPKTDVNLALPKTSPLKARPPKVKGTINDETKNDYRQALSLLEKKFGILLDNSERSLPELDKLISIEAEEFNKGPLNNSQFRDEISVILVAMGIVFGEIVRVNLGGDWVFDPEVSRKLETINETFLLKEKNLIDPFEVFYKRVLRGMPINLVDFYREAGKLYGGTSLISASLTTTQKQRLAWICPNCNAPNHTPIELFTQTSITCPNCSKNFRCITGEVAWGQCMVTTYHYDQYLDWAIRLQQQGGSIVEVTFTLRNPDFTITNGDFIVVLMKTKFLGGEEVTYVENKTTEKVIRPGK